jgi:hypothetical protein
MAHVACSRLKNDVFDRQIRQLLEQEIAVCSACHHTKMRSTAIDAECGFAKIESGFVAD